MGRLYEGLINNEKAHTKEQEGYESMYLSKICVTILILLVFPFTASLSLSVEENLIAPAAMSITSPTNATSTANITNTNATTALNLIYIWSITGIEKDQITMALNQDGNDLFGQAKYEPDGGEPWNGEVGGLISGKHVYLVITALKGDKQVSTMMEGTIADDAISGRFFQSSEGQISGRGEFNAISINPDLSGYTPVKITEPKMEMPTSATDVTAPADTGQVSQQAASKKSKYHDVHEDADRILTGVGDISQIPIGMGGSGLP